MIKRIIVATILLLVKSSFVLCVQGQTPKDPVFIITLEQNGSASGESMQKYVEAKYWPCAIWNSGYFGARTLVDKSVPGVQTAATPEGLLSIRGSIAGMKPGEVLLFYEREKSGTGKAGDCSAKLSTIGDGVFSWDVTDNGKTTTYSSSRQAANSMNRTSGPAANMNALIKRTKEGAVLTFSEPILEAEGYCDFFGLFNGNNVPKDMSEVLSFTLSNDDLKNWSTLQKINDRTLPGTEEGSLHIRAILRGSTSSTEAEVSLEGCSELGVGEQGQVTASGKPEGGSYRFWVEPQDILTVESNGTSAILHGSSPGHGTLYVEYTNPEGKTAQASKPASCVKVESYNGGQAIPQIAFYDADGKHLPGILKIPVSMEPSGTSDILRFIPADPGILTAWGMGNEINLQGIHTGKTTFQAKTNCDGVTGPVADVEVVNCDDETIATLDRMMKAAKENQKEDYQEIEKITGSKEYKEAAENITKSTVDLAWKTALTIAVAGKNSEAVETAVEIAEAGTTLKDLFTSGNSEKLESNELLAMMKVTGSKALKAIAGVTEVVEAASEFGKNLGTLKGTEGLLQNAMKTAEQSNKQIEEIVRRQRLCRKDSQQPPGKESPKAEPTPKPTEPTADKKTPPSQEPVPTTGNPPIQEPPADEPPAGDPPISPPPPTTEPRQVGLPYMPDECGCQRSQGIGLSQEGFSTLQSGMENLGKCVDNFNKGPLAGYIQTLNEWAAVTDSLAEVVKSKPAEFKVAAGKVVPRIDDLIGRTKSYDEAAKIFVGDFKGCPESMKAGIEIINSAKNIPEISVTGKY